MQIRAKNVPPFHYDESLDCCILTQEAALLQTFPDDYAFCGNLASVYKQIGNAVPVDFAKEIAQSMERILRWKYAGIDD